MNKNNINNLRMGQYGRVLNLDEKSGGKPMTVFLPTIKSLANARIMVVNKAGDILVHWKDNYNMHGDFSTELMAFDVDLVLDREDKAIRNKVRKNNGLLPIK